MSVALVTGYVRLNNRNRGHEEYVRLAGELLSLHRPTVAFLDGITPPDGVVSVPYSLRDCWMTDMAHHAKIPAGNHQKDTAAYHSVQHEKTRWIAEAAGMVDAEWLVWCDIGIFHNPAIHPQHVLSLLRSVERERPLRITLPSIWPLDASSPIPTGRVCWYVAGGVAIVPRAMAADWHELVRAAAVEHYEKTGYVTWEVNTWAAAVKANPAMFSLYEADHDETMFSIT